MNSTLNGHMKPNQQTADNYMQLMNNNVNNEQFLPFSFDFRC